jgi:hypothetical protein
MNSNLRKLFVVNRTGSVNNILGQFNPKISLNEGANDYMIKTVDSPTQKPFFGRATDIQIPLTDESVHIVNSVNRSLLLILIQLLTFLKVRLSGLPSHILP